MPPRKDEEAESRKRGSADVFLFAPRQRGSVAAAWLAGVSTATAAVASAQPTHVSNAP